VVNDELGRPTRADRYRRRFADHPVGAVLILVIVTFGAIGAAVGGARDVVSLFDPETTPTPSSSAGTGPVELSSSDLKVARNWRYGFTVNYPADWLRNDPVNQDGIVADGPETGMTVTAYGALAPGAASIADLEAAAEAKATEPGTFLLEGPTLQNATWRDVSGRNSELPGIRVVVQELATEGEPEVVTVSLLTTAEGRNVTASCQVPAELADHWRGACNEIIGSLTVLGTWSQ
jgi:hypothetical protein